MVMHKTVKIVIAAILLNLVALSHVLAQISVNDVIINFQAGARPVQNVVVSNASENPMYVTVSVEKIDKPGEDNSPRSATDELLVSPRQFSVDARGERTVRLLLKRQPQAAEQLYRVMFVPQDRKFGEDEEPDGNAPRALIKVLTGMGILVFADPVKPSATLTWKRDKNHLVFNNEGNIHVRLIQGKACTKEKEECTELRSKRIYGGSSYTYDVDDKKTIYFTKRVGASGEFETLVIPPA